MKTLYEYWRSLSENEKQEFCQKVGVTYEYMNIHLIHKRRKPRLDAIQSMVDASNGVLTLESLFDFFLSNQATA